MASEDQRAGAAGAAEALKACAHCNGEAKQQRKEQEGYGPAFAVMCTACACSTPWVDTMGWAFALWNLRASDKREGEASKAWNGEAVEPEDVLSDKEIGAFQDAVRGILVDAVNKAGGTGDRIDGGGCDSGYWPDLTLSEVGQGVGMLEEIIAELKQPKPAGEAGGWVKCSERMPSPGSVVMVYRPDGFPENDRHTALFTGQDAPMWMDPDDGFRDVPLFQIAPASNRITHWMPLPKPPEPKAGEG